MAALFAVATALAFGASDFAGGLASRRSHVLGVTLVAQLAGFVVLAVLLAMFPAELSVSALVAGAVAGLAGIAGLVLYLRALAIGPMGVASPVSAVMGAALPVGIGIFGGERPSTLASLGIVLGLIAVVLATRVDRNAELRPSTSSRRGPMLALIGGVGFGIFYVALDASPEASGLWPLVAARLAALAFLLVFAAVARRALVPKTRDVVWLAVATGVLEMAANGFFLAATRSGLLSLAALISSLYPVVVAALAHGFLRERLDTLQWAGVAICLGAVALIALG